MVEHYLPVSLAGVQAYSGKDKLNFVGHSNGCRAGVATLNLYSQIGKGNVGYVFNYKTGNYDLIDLSSYPVDKFIGIGCPFTMNNDTFFMDNMRKSGDAVLEGLENKKHISFSDVGLPLLISSVTWYDWEVKYPTKFISMFEFGDKISYHLMQNYADLINDRNSAIDLSNLDVNKIYIFQTQPDDLIVHYQDAEDIINSATLVDSEDKEIIPFELTYANPVKSGTDHSRITEHPELIKDLKEVLRND